MTQKAESNIIFNVLSVSLVVATRQMQVNAKRLGKASYLAAAIFACAMRAAAPAQAAPVPAAPAPQSQPAVQDAASPADTASADAIENRKDLEQAWEDASQDMNAIYSKFNMMNRIGIARQFDRAAFMKNRDAMMKVQSRVMAAQQRIQSRPEDSLQVLIDMYYASAGEPVDDGVVEPLVKALRDDSWRVREQATQKLKAMGMAAWPKLLTYAQDADLEVRCRIEYLLNKDSSEQRLRMERYATAVAASMKLEDLLPVARKNFLRLLEDDSGGQDSNHRVRQPLLASLRYSQDVHDRDLQTLAKALAKPGSEGTLNFLLQQAARNQFGQPVMNVSPSPFWNAPPPKHDENGATDRIMNGTDDPAIFAKAASCVEHDGRFIDRMKALRQKTSNKAIARQIDKLLTEAAKKP